MNAVWFKRQGQGETEWYRCGRCRDYCQRERGGFYLSLGPKVIAVVCHGCAPATRQAVAELIPHSWPDLDDRGVLLYDPDAR